MPHVKKSKRRPSVTRRAKIVATVCGALVVILVFGGLYLKQQETLRANAEVASTYTPRTVTPRTVEPSPAPTPTSDDAKWAPLLAAAPTVETTFENGIPATVGEYTLSTVSNPAIGSDYTVEAGKLTNTATGAERAASYLETDLGKAATRVGATFSFTPGTGATPDGGAVMIGAWNSSIAASFPTIPNSPAHFVITRDGWQYGVWDTATTNQVVKSGYFIAPLKDDGTEYTSEVLIDGDTAYLVLPDGTRETVTDPRISERAGAFPCWEVYQNNAATESKAAFTRVWAS